MIELIKEKLKSYVDGIVSLEEFQLWFHQIVWDVDDVVSLETRNLIYKIKLALTEYTNKNLTENELRNKLSRKES